jgi:UDP-N-acetylglucosamine--N-acetylmuramyl-(pentapeptide) pyrophosphoryl-undecaprenol N-acetylglucosamine transferase
MLASGGESIPLVSWKGENMGKKIVITGGHLTPALAVIEELRKRNWEIIFIGRKYAAEGNKTLSVESKVIPSLGIPFFPIQAGKIQRYFNRWTIPALFRLPFGFIQAFFYLRRFKPNVVLSFGGYVSAPVVFSAWLLKVPVITHEQTTVKGLATKFNSIFAEKIAVSWPNSLKEFPKKKVVLTGNPIRKEIFKFNERIWKILNFEKNLPLIFVTGGNQGSHIINKTVGEIIPQLTKTANVFHQCGHLNALGDFEKLEELRNKLPSKLKSRYHVKKYLVVEEMGTILRKAELVISRAGANTLTELAWLGKPCILIPFPWLYQNEQEKNAKMLAQTGIAEILLQKDLSGEKLLHLIRKMLANISLYRKKANLAKKLVRPKANQKIADLVEEVAK